MPSQNAKLEGWSQRMGASPNETLMDQVAYYARVSNPTSQISALKSDGLIRYLMRHKHWSPFEMVNICLQADTTRDIGRQLIRHRSFSFQEFSQRYAATETMGDYRETRLQDLKNRQNSLETDDEELDQWWKDKQDEVAELAFDTYDQALKKGIAKEQVRAILPEGLTWSRLYVNGTLRSWIHYIELRTDPSTQKEHRDLAKMCAREIDKVFPMISDFVQD
jgi:thymidylate synthase (FAD)